MKLDEKIQQFEKEFKELLTLDDQLSEKAAEKFEAKLLEIQPIIQCMKKNGVYFTHPDLFHSQTSVGVIIGKNHQNERYVYVYDGYDMIVKEVDTAVDNTVPVQGKTLSIHRFFANCNYEFAIKGINHTAEALSRVLEGFKQDLDEKRTFIEAL